MEGAAQPHPAGVCHVAWVPAGWGAARGDLLSAAEHERRRRLRRRGDRDRFTTGRVLTRIVLAQRLGTGPAAVRVVRTCPDCGGPHGKPRLAGDDRWQFSVAHSGDLVGLAVAFGVPVGLDVERVVPLEEGELGAFLTEHERRELAGLPDAERAAAALRLWVRKESLAKATGAGLRADLTAYSVGPPLAAPTVAGLVEGRAAADLSLVDLRAVEGYVASVAGLAPLIDVVEEHLAPLPA